MYKTILDFEYAQQEAIEKARTELKEPCSSCDYLTCRLIDVSTLGQDGPNSRYDWRPGCGYKDNKYFEDDEFILLKTQDNPLDCPSEYVRRRVKEGHYDL